MQCYDIAVIRGDGIGPELIDAALEVLEAVSARAGFALRYTEVDAGADTYRRTGIACAAQDLDLIRSGVAFRQWAGSSLSMRPGWQASRSGPFRGRMSRKTYVRISSATRKARSID